MVAGFFYFAQMRNHLLRMEEFSLIEYARHLKMNLPLTEFTGDFSHIFIDETKHIDIKNFTVGKKRFSKLIPQKFNKGYIKVSKSTKTFNQKVSTLKHKIQFLQLLLLLLFAYISYRLARNALQPLKESISTLDKFAKDLIHDLNTPVTSINLNMRVLEKNPQCKNNKALLRLKKSVQSISELHENLTILLEEETFQFQELNVCKIVDDVVQVQQTIYPNIKFEIQCNQLKAKLNPNATKQILQNIISNACQYNIQNGYVKIYTNNKSLFIENSGKGIKEPDKIFNRSYSEVHSSGIGLDIVKRLGFAMDILIEVKAKRDGTIFILTMP